jgi:hypothetical protein
MPAKYLPPSSHALLSQAARRLSPDELDAHALAAETILARGSVALVTKDYEAGSSEYSRAVNAVVYQINFQLEAGTDAEVYGTVQRGGRRIGYRGGEQGPMPAVSSRAQAIIDGLIDLDVAADFPTIGSLR